MAVGEGRMSSVVLRASEQPDQGVLVEPVVVSFFLWAATGGAGAKAEEPGGVRAALQADQV